jgi:uncharacterized protein involved in type VI secretion and phage assembly
MTAIQKLPALNIELGGAALSASDARTLRELRVQQRLSLPALCELTFIDSPRQLAETSVVGTPLRITTKESAELFSGEITAVQHVYDPRRGEELRLRGYDLLHRLRKRQPVRAHVQLTLADLFNELLADSGVTVDAAEAGPLWQRLIQYRHSDFALAAELAERCGLYFTLRENVLHLFTLKGEGDEVPLELGKSLLEARIEVNADSSCSSVSTTGWDPLRVEQHSGKAASARSGREVSAEAGPELVGGQGERSLVDETLQDDRQAEAIAQAELDLHAAGEVVLWGVAEFDNKLRPGATVNVKGVARQLAGKYVLTAVDHTVDSEKGFVSTISTAPPAAARRNTHATAALGIVTHVNDPEGLGRVRLKLPTFEDVETDWLCVLTAGAGMGKGLLALPDVNDTVLVLFPHGDPAQGVVLGGLYGTERGPNWDWGIDEEAVKRYTFITSGGQKLRLDDSKKLIRLENSDGSYVELAPERVLLHAATDLQLEAPGRRVIVKGQAIDFQQS